MNEDIVECYCDDEEDDGTMMFCEKCHKWQHAVCVNWNNFTAPPKYICPTCQGIQIDCACKTESDFQHAVIQCSKCNLYQHKRHVGIGIGENPTKYVCSKCTKAGANAGGRILKIEPNLDFFPSFNEKIIPQDINKFPYTIPQGRFLTKLREYSLGSPITPVRLTCSMLTYFRDILFKSHPTLKYFDYVKYYPERNVKDACQFMFYITKTLAYMCNISVPKVLQIFDHIITKMIFKDALPNSVKESVTNDAEDDYLVVNMSDRAQDNTRSNYKLNYFTRPRENVPLKIVAGLNAFPTVISLVDIRECDFICRIWGYCMDFEEIDQQNQVPDFSIYSVARSKLFVNSTKVKGHPIFSHIRRGIVSNCEVRLFKTTLKGSKKKVVCAGIFATKPTLMQHLIDAKPTIDGMYIHNNSANETEDNHGSEEVTETSKKGNKNKYVIFAGDELVLPFDLAPMFIKNDAEWRNGQVDSRLVNIDDQIDMNLFKPLKPANSNVEEMKSVNEINSKSSIEKHISQLMSSSIEVEPKVFKENETSMQNIFSKDEPIQLDFRIESSQTKPESLSASPSNTSLNSKNNKSSKIDDVPESCINSDSDEQSFQITSKNDLQNFLKKKADGSLADLFSKNDAKNDIAMITPLKKKRLFHSLAPYDPLQGKKSWYQPVESEEKNQELNFEFRDQWNPISPAVSFKKKNKPKITPADFWSEDPIDFVDVSDGDLK